MRVQTQSDIRPIVLRVAAKWINFELILHWVSSIALFLSFVPRSCSLRLPFGAIVHCGNRISYFTNAHWCVALCAVDNWSRNVFFVPTGFIIQFIIRLFLPLFFSLPLSCSLPIHCAVCQHKSMHSFSTCTSSFAVRFVFFSSSSVFLFCTRTCFQHSQQDYITIFDGYTTRDPVILKFCGGGGDGLPAAISSGPELLVEFVTSPFGSFTSSPVQSRTLNGFQLEVKIDLNYWPYGLNLFKCKISFVDWSAIRRHTELLVCEKQTTVWVLASWHWPRWIGESTAFVAAEHNVFVSFARHRHRLPSIRSIPFTASNRHHIAASVSLQGMDIGAEIQFVAEIRCVGWQWLWSRRRHYYRTR